MNMLWCDQCHWSSRTSNATNICTQKSCFKFNYYHGKVDSKGKAAIGVKITIRLSGKSSNLGRKAFLVDFCLAQG